MGIFHRLRLHHPRCWQACIWALPAIAFGAVLRAILLSYLPHAYWGSDSNSYYGFAHTLLERGELSLYDKRRYLYPIFLLPVSLLPGATLKWVALLQHGFGLLTLVPLAYCVRRIFVGWRVWVVPVTVAYAGLPMLLWYEHELLAETFFFAAIVWMLAGWLAWAARREDQPAPGLWWVFYAGLALFVLTKPAGRFLWPGVGLALLAGAAWRRLGWREGAALAALCGLSFTIGQESQGAWLLYTSSFPLTRLETPLHAEYKAEIAPLVRRARARLERPDVEDAAETKDWKFFLKNPEQQTEFPRWQALGRDPAARARIYRDLALEGIRSRPDLFLGIALRKIAASANASEFKSARFEPAFTLEKFQHLYERDAASEPRRMQRLLGLPRGAELPPYAQIVPRLAPAPDSPWPARMRTYVETVQRGAAFLDAGEDDAERARLTALGWWTLAAALLSLAPGYFRRLGVWTVALLGYLLGVYLVGGANPRFFGPAWPVIALLLPVPLDAVLRLARAVWNARQPREVRQPLFASR
jgi:hypothetical protein